MTVEELIAAIRDAIDTVGRPGSPGPYGTLEAIGSLLDDFEEDAGSSADV